MIPAGVLARVSRDDPDDDRKLSIQTQIEADVKLAGELGCSVSPDHIWKDQGISGTLGPKKRKGLASALAAADAGEIKVLVLFDRSRLARDEELFFYLAYRLREAGCRLVFCMKDDVSQIERMVEVWAESEYPRKTRERIMRSLQSKASRQEYTGGKNCLGLRWVPAVPPEVEAQLRAKEQTVPMRRELDPDTAWVGRKIAYLADPAQGGKPIAEIARLTGLRPLRIRRFLRNPAIAGGYCYGRSKQVQQDGWKALDRSLWPPIVWGSHPALIPVEQWERIQARLDDQAARHKVENPGRVRLALSGLLRCTACGWALAVQSAPRRGDGLGRRYYYYRCLKPGCGAVGPVPGHKWVDMILREMILQLGQKGLAETLAEALNRAMETGRTQGHAEAEIQQLERRVENLTEAIGSGELEDVRPLARQLGEFQRRLESLRSLQTRDRAGGRSVVTAAAVRASLRAILRDLGRAANDVDPAKNAHAILHRLIQSIDCNPETGKATLTMRPEAILGLHVSDRADIRALRYLSVPAISWRLAS